MHGDDDKQELIPAGKPEPKAETSRHGLRVNPADQAVLEHGMAADSLGNLNAAVLYLASLGSTNSRKTMGKVLELMRYQLPRLLFHNYCKQHSKLKNDHNEFAMLHFNKLIDTADKQSVTSV